MTVHREIERKFDADGAFALPAALLNPAGGSGPALADGSSLPWVERVEGPETIQLEATYFDTPDLRLVTHRRTLRRRVGGTDEGWHLKLPDEAGARLEVREPLGDGEAVPERLLALVRALTRTAPVQPVARVSTTRTVYRLLDADGRVVVELADDDVHAQTLGPGAEARHWREIEAELGDASHPGTPGTDSRLEDVAELLLAAGARLADTPSKLARALGPQLERALARLPTSPRPGKRSSAGDAVVAYLRQHLDALIEADPRLREGDEEGVHDVRVAARRMRSALQAFGSLFADPETVGALIEELRWLGVALSTARDQEVLLDHLRAQLAQLPPELVLGPVHARLTESLLGEASRDRAAREQAGHPLDSARYLDLLDTLEAFITAPPLTPEARRPAREVLPGYIHRAERRLARRVGRVAAERDRATTATTTAATSTPARLDAAFHDVRKAAKRARYANEVAAPALGKRTARAARHWQEVQETLGTRQDSVVARALLRRLGAAGGGAGENGFTFGLLYGLELERAARAERAFAEIWAGGKPGP